ncbi:MAG: hypothetical protein K0S47_4057 [Herbinix sp.]|jgi:hypothetical protein|nr:hypothetical protein [Herbinix sp.]
MALARMRTAQQVYDEIHKEDPESSVSLWYIRSVIKQGKVPVLKAGTKYPINYDRFCEYLVGDLPEADLEAAQNFGVIRKVSE